MSSGTPSLAKNAFNKNFGLAGSKPYDLSSLYSLLWEILETCSFNSISTNIKVLLQIQMKCILFE